MSGWRILTARRTGDEPTADDAEADVSDRTSHDVRAREHGDELVVTVYGRDGDALREFVKANADAFDLVAVVSGNDTGPGAERVTFYEPEGRTLEKQTSGTLPLAYDGLRPAGR